MRKSGNRFEPPALSARNIADFARHLGEVLILAEYYSHIEFSVPRHAHDIQPKP